MELNLRAAGHFFVFGEIREQEKVTSGKIRGVGRVRQSFNVREIHLRELALEIRCVNHEEVCETTHDGSSV